MAKSESGATGLIRGKVGGWVFYVVNGTQRIRELTPVFNPQSARQMEIRSINTELSRRWRDVLNEGQRTAWRQRAEGSGMRGGLFYIRQNFQLLDFGLPTQDTPPPMVMPPEMTDVVIDTGSPTVLRLFVPALIEGTITSQTPFIDVEIAGGFIEANPPINENGYYTSSFDTEALSQGRLHQNSDFRHVFYAADLAILAIPAPQDSEITAQIPSETIRNVVIRLTRFNKFGNKSGSLIFNAIIPLP